MLKQVVDLTENDKGRHTPGAQFSQQIIQQSPDDSQLEDSSQDPISAVLNSESNARQDALPADQALLGHRTSFVWNHMPNADPQHIYQNDKLWVEWRCAYCTRRYRESGGTRIISHHLKKEHHIEKDSPRQEKNKRARGAIESAMDAVARSGGYKKRRMEAVEVKAEYMVDPHVLELLIVRWFTSDSIPLSTVESDEFRALMADANRDIGAWLPSSGNTVKNWIIRHFVAEKAKKISSMAKARSLIHVSCDMAVSSNGLPIMVWMAHYIDEFGDLIVAPLAVREIQGSHDQDNLAKNSMEVLIEWEIAERIGYWVMDNARVNDALLRGISISKLRLSSCVLIDGRTTPPALCG